MKEFLNNLKNKYDMKLKTLNQMFISLEKDQIILRSSKISQQMLQYIDQKQLGEYIVNAIIPIIKNYKLKITTKD